MAIRSAYYWEFETVRKLLGGTTSRFRRTGLASAGEYAVRCVVSDMRGGTAQHKLIVRVGTSSVFALAATSWTLQPSRSRERGITSGSRSVFSDSDGSYIIPGHGAGSFTVSAIEPVSGAVELVSSVFQQPGGSWSGCTTHRLRSWHKRSAGSHWWRRALTWSMSMMAQTTRAQHGRDIFVDVAGRARTQLGYG